MKSARNGITQLMQDINFISGGSGGSKRSKGKKQSRDIQYTSGEVLDATQEMKRVEEKKEENKKKASKKKAPKAKKKSFFEWRTEREVSAQEKAEAEERKQREKEEKAKKESSKRIAKERERFQEEMKEAKKRSSKRRKVEEEPEQETPRPQPAPIPVPQPPKEDDHPLHGAPEEHHEDRPDLLHAQAMPQEMPKKEQPRKKMHVAKETLHQAPASNLLDGSVYSMPQPAGPTNEKSDKKTATKKGSAKIHVPPAIAKHAPKRKWFTLTRQELDTTALDVNLIPDEILDQLRARNYLRELVYVAVAALMIVLIVFAAMNIYQRKLATDTATIEAQIQEFDREIAGYISLQTEISTLSGRLSSLHSVLDSHVYWSPFMEKLEELTVSTVYYTSMSGSANTGQFSFNAIARSYSDLDAQVRVMRQSPYVKAVQVTSAAATQETVSEGEEESAEDEETIPTVSFILTVEFDPALFEYASNENGEEQE